MSWPGAKSLDELKETYVFPEWTAPPAETWLNRTENLGVSFSGGGSRAFSSALGQICALRLLGLWPKVRYATSTSGGSWALTSYSYRNRSADTFLGNCSTLSKNLEISSPLAALSFPSEASLIEDYTNLRGSQWIKAIAQIFIAPGGADPDAIMGWVNTSSNNNTASLYTPNEDPYPLIGISIWGPASETPRTNGSLRVITTGPFAVGTGLESNVSYNDNTFAFGGFVTPSNFPHMTLTTAAGFSSFAQGGALATLFGKIINTAAGLPRSYTSNNITIQDMLYADGGTVENVHLSALLQRGVTRIFAFFNTITPLNLDFDPYTEIANASLVADDLTSFFGIKDTQASPTHDYSGIQLFATSDLPPLLKALQDSVRSGLGGIVTSNHTTIENIQLGVPSGLHVTITWYYLSFSSLWLDQLSPISRKLIEKDPLFIHFPHFSTADLHLSVAQASALASLASWTLLHNNVTTSSLSL
mmetsp:Transcript_19296/g.25048  ORF Transcript_19296/g.25048 Transcript_19296/m.25048 type:complete len:474 (-) Transcript_19296:23-1444(-)